MTDRQDREIGKSIKYIVMNVISFYYFFKWSYWLLYSVDCTVNFDHQKSLNTFDICDI